MTANRNSVSRLSRGRVESLFMVGSCADLRVGGSGCALGPRGFVGMCARLRTHFSCFAKKSKQKKATPLSASLRFAAGNLRCSQNGGDTQTRFAQTRVSLIPVLLRCSAHTEGEVRMQSPTA